MRLAAACAALLVSGSALAKEAETWSFAATGYWNDPREAETQAYASGTVTADRGALHLEGRANYEAIHAQSAFVGWTFSWAGETLKLDATPLVGGVTGAARGPIAGLEATITAGKFDYYIEAEHVNERKEGVSSYNYAWTELGWRASDAVRIGIAAQRTRIYGSEREIQRGPLVQVTAGKATFSAYWFNPGESAQVIIVSAGMGSRHSSEAGRSSKIAGSAS